ncbi:sorting nexin-15 isoform X3 [Hemicordylus capensis]|uniref:sorting nexin-15 isoform X3 n=1 Tax=Hemicordylus capensis TaxID=884348 RepID=UPI0023040A03|nr:sorting nexin-15 isoform X3 [Hemicordylus capensis]
MSRRGAKEEHQRHYTVSDPRSHPKGHTEYKVTAKFVSKADPEDAKEIVVWKRYSDFKKLHGELAYIHRNLFRRLEDFPSFPKAQVFGRFEPEVIEERRKAAEAMLRFTAHIPALNNSPQLKEFFRGGEGRRPPETTGPAPPLPPPLIPVPLEGVEPGEDALGSMAEHTLLAPERKPEAARKVCLLEPQAQDGALMGPLDTGGSSSPPAQCDDDEALDALFAASAAGEEEEEEEGGGRGGGAEAGSPSRSLLSVQELALFDPFTKEGDPDVLRREAVKKKTAEYLQRAEEIFQQHVRHLQP